MKAKIFERDSEVWTKYVGLCVEADKLYETDTNKYDILRRKAVEWYLNMVYC
jgi:hypothetical protein